MKSIYLDYAAATPLDARVFKVMEPYFSQQFYNPSETYLAARAVRQDIEIARSTVAQILGAKPAEIIFSSGATEANNLAIRGVMDAHPKGEVLVSAIEHESVLAPAKGYKRRLIPVTKQGIVDLAKLESMITEQTVLVSVMLVNNELGTIQPLAEIRQILNRLSKFRSSRLPLYLHTDAAQAANLLDLHVSRLGLDLLSLNGGKIYGPKQSGCLYIRGGTSLQPQITGGGQEFGWRSGTENVPSIIGLAKALELAVERRPEEAKRLSHLREKFVIGLSEQLPAAIINGSSKHQAAHIASATFPGSDNERLMMELDEAGVISAVGSACSASHEQASHVLKAIGLNDDLAHSTLRFSFGRQTTEADINKCLAKLRRLPAFNR